MTTAIKSKKKPASSKLATVRVAIYTRKSVTAGFEQEFNSLDAQREAVEAYVASQRGLGWAALPQPYDDNGFSGSNVERPAFRRLMQDIASGEVDVVCVYRMDRLSRSLLDFTRLTEFLHEHSVGFVSITESFDTSSPMGRMVLGMLATFAQFERESIAQRTSDKIIASRRRGMWTGGRPPLGYDVIEKKLIVNEAEAERVREIFALYTGLGSILAAVKELKLRRWHTKSWSNKKGEQIVGRPFTKCSLRGLLTNPIYLGKVRCGDEACDGAHKAILDEETWGAANDRVRGGNTDSVNNVSPRSTDRPALLRGIAKCAVCGSALTHHYTTRGNKCYGYYVCTRQQKEGADACPGSRVSASELEAFVLDQVRDIGRDPKLLSATLRVDQENREMRVAEAKANAKDSAMRTKQIHRERKNLVASTTKESAPSRMEEVAALEARIAHAVREEDAAKRELRALKLGEIGPDELRDVLVDLEPIWTELYPAERQRVLALLIERVEFNGAAGEVTITFRPGGPRAIKQPKRGGEQ